jgi:hypothetical protein
MTSGLTRIGWLPTDPSLDLVELGNACQHLGGERRLVGGVEFVERPPGMGPTERQPERGILACFDQVAEPGIAINLQRAFERRQVLGRMRTSAVLGVDVGGRRMSGSDPRTIIDSIAPEPPGLGLSPAGIEHRQCRLIGEQLVR